MHHKLIHHFIKHGKRLGAHIHKHHKKYLFGGTIYGMSHLLIANILAVKLLAVKILLGVLALIGITNPSLHDIFAKMDNICIDNNPLIAQQSCEKNFDNIQDAVTYLESMVDPETDTIYNAQYYGIIKSTLNEYCGTQLSRSAVIRETRRMNDISKLTDVGKKILLWEDAHDKWKLSSWQTGFSGEKDFCNQKYLAYSMLDLSQRLFLKELKKQGLLSPKPILS
jgi:hypothetical protein